MTKTVRLLDLDLVPSLRSQTIYHTIAENINDSGNTIILLSPSEPYVCIGFHQELAKEVDLEYCSRNNILVLRRQVGGGAVYLDNNQLFYQIIFHRDDVLKKIEEVYRKFLQGPAETYRGLGISAQYRPVNDIHVEGRKIAGTGAAGIGDAMVVVGNIMLDFNFQEMSRILKVPDDKFRDKVYKTMSEYLTTIKKELGSIPPRDEIKNILVKKFEDTIGIELEAGELTPGELEMVKELDSKFLSDKWLHLVEEKHKFNRVKISEDVSVVESSHKSPGGLIRTTIEVKDNQIEDILISGDFFIYPDILPELEDALKGASLDKEILSEKIKKFYAENDIQSPGVVPENFIEAIIQAKAE